MSAPTEGNSSPKQTGTFDAIGNSNKRMYGETALLVAGYSPEEQSQLKELLSDTFQGPVPAVFVDDALKEHTLAQLAATPDLNAEGRPSSLPRAIIMSGLSEVELHGVMKAYRSAGLPHQIWASVTPVSASWTLGYLLEELRKEKEDLRKAMAAKRAREAAQQSDD